MGVFQAIDRFESRSSLKTWIFQILVNRARTHAQRERHMVPFSQLVRREVDTAELAVDPDCFQTPDEELPGHWSSPPHCQKVRRSYLALHLLATGELGR